MLVLGERSVERLILLLLKALLVADGPVERQTELFWLLESPVVVDRLVGASVLLLLE